MMEWKVRQNIPKFPDLWRRKQRLLKLQYMIQLTQTRMILYPENNVGAQHAKPYSPAT